MPEVVDRRTAILGDYARDLGKLKDEPSWEILRERFEAMKKADVESLARKILTGTTPDAEHLAERRGFWKGAQWVIDNPDLAQQAFDRAMKGIASG